MSNIYCGVGQIPKGKERGSLEDCIKANQVRYYGLEAFDPKLIKEVKNDTREVLLKESLKFHAIASDAKILLNKINRVELIINHKDSTAAEIKRAQKRLDALTVRRVAIKKKFLEQKQRVADAQRAVEQTEEEEARRKKLEAKTKKKPNTATKAKSTKSGSKTSTKKASTKKTSTKASTKKASPKKTSTKKTSKKSTK